MVMGRPTKYSPDLIPRVIELMSQGWSIEELCLEFMVSKSSIYEWAKIYPDFSHALAVGSDLSAGWHIKLARENYHDKDFNDRLWYRNMANRFGWRDKVDNNINATISHEEQLKALDK